MKIKEELVNGQLDELFAEFGTEYLQKPAGQEHIKSYARSREQGRSNWEKVLERDSAHEDVTDLVLNGLLPHYASSGKRAPRPAIIFLALKVAPSRATTFPVGAAASSCGL